MLYRLQSSQVLAGELQSKYRHPGKELPRKVDWSLQENLWEARDMELVDPFDSQAD